MLLQLQNLPAAIELKQEWYLFAKFSYVMMDQTFFLILQHYSLKMGCNSLEEAVGITDWQFQFLGRGYELLNWEGERKQRQKGITQYCSSGLALFLSECGAEGYWHSQFVCLSPGGTLDNGAELAVLGQFREGGEICHSLCIPSFLQGNEVSWWEGK